MEHEKPRVISSLSGAKRSLLTLQRTRLPTPDSSSPYLDRTRPQPSAHAPLHLLLPRRRPESTTTRVRHEPRPLAARSRTSAARHRHGSCAFPTWPPQESKHHRGLPQAIEAVDRRCLRARSDLYRRPTGPDVALSSSTLIARSTSSPSQWRPKLSTLESTTPPIGAHSTPCLLSGQGVCSLALLALLGASRCVLSPCLTSLLLTQAPTSSFFISDQLRNPSI